MVAVPRSRKSRDYATSRPGNARSDVASRRKGVTSVPGSSSHSFRSYCWGSSPDRDYSGQKREWQRISKLRKYEGTSSICGCSEAHSFRQRKPYSLLVATQLAKRRNRSSAGEPGSAVYAVNVSPVSAGRSIASNMRSSSPTSG